MEKIRTARKTYKCVACDKSIISGTKYLDCSVRYAKYKSLEDYRQTGIEYVRYKVHLPEDNCTWPKECRKGNHEFVLEFSTEDYQAKDYYCINCGNLKS